MDNFTISLLKNCVDVKRLSIHLKELDYDFLSKPLLVGGKAMEYYKMRKSWNDIDLVITKNDYNRLSKKYPNKIKKVIGNSCIRVRKFELWENIRDFKYDFLTQNAVKQKEFLIISFEKLMFLKVACVKSHPKHLRDLKLMQDKITQIKNIRHGFH